MFEIAFRDDDKSGSLAMLPNKFRKMIWVKTRDFVIVEGYDEERSVLESESSTEAQLGADADASASASASASADANADADAVVDLQVEFGGAAIKDKSQASKIIQYAIKHILTREQIKHLRKTGLWPEGLQAESLGHPVPGADSAGLGAPQPGGACTVAAAPSSSASSRDRDRQAMPDMPPRSDDYGRGSGYGAYGGVAQEGQDAEEYEYEDEEEEIFYDKMGNTITREAAQALAAKSSAPAGEGGK
jgi:hypothetical protein